MANKTISDLPEKTTASNTDYMIIENSSETNKISKANRNRKDIKITVDKSKVFAEIKCKDLTDYTTNLYKIDITTNLTGDLDNG